MTPSSSPPDPDLKPTPAGRACPVAIEAAGPAAHAAWDAFASSDVFRPVTRAFYCRIALRFLEWLEPQGVGLTGVVPEWVERFLDAQDVDLSSKSQYRTGLRRFFDALVSHGAIPSNPANQAQRGSDDPLETAKPEQGQGGSDESHNDEAAPTLAELKAAVRELDPAAMDDTPEMLDAGVVLLAGLHLGTAGLAPISRFTGVHPRRVAKFARRLRANGVWTTDGKTAAMWDDDEGGWVALLTDILIAVGMVECRSADGDGPAKPEGDTP